MGSQCKGLCKNFIGYKKGLYCFAMNKNVACIVCGYQIPPKYINCHCCGQKYRKKSHYKLRDRDEREKLVIRIG